MYHYNSKVAIGGSTLHGSAHLEPQRLVPISRNDCGQYIDLPKQCVGFNPCAIPCVIPQLNAPLTLPIDWPLFFCCRLFQCGINSPEDKSWSSTVDLVYV